jgi:hypothetical protein
MTTKTWKCVADFVTSIDDIAKAAHGTGHHIILNLLQGCVFDGCPRRASAVVTVSACCKEVGLPASPLPICSEHHDEIAAIQVEREQRLQQRAAMVERAMGRRDDA